ncbi:MAG: cell wall-binding repeat-containing protein [Dethiobacter sp.]|jgi:putative cell wall-binding protein|nr:cell wall-binding repeat-containing protein [Dethiobacter sp.]
MKKIMAAVVLMVLLILPAVTFASGITVNRIWGDTRYETAVEISKSGWTSSSTVYLATGENYADALAGAPLAYHHNAPILLTNTNSLNQAAKGEIIRLNASKVVILGGPVAVAP